MKAAEILCPEKQQLFKNMSVSENTVAECVNDLAGDI
jgi:ABC-type branched-subunit amino acid transport system ATPase component